jgi:hypothetical protein
MKCYRIREEGRVCFVMESRLGRIDKNYSVELGSLSLKIYLNDGSEMELVLLMDEETYALFEMRWERFHVSDEIFFDFGEFQ